MTQIIKRLASKLPSAWRRKLYLLLQMFRIVPANPFLYARMVRLFHFRDAYRLIENVEGDIVELGVGPGFSLTALKTLIEMEDKGRLLYGLDTFKGLPYPGKEDLNQNNQFTAGGKGAFASSSKEVWQFLKDALLPNLRKVRLIEGNLKDTLPNLDVDKIALLHIDVDLYEGHKLAFKHLYSRMPSSALVMLDDYENPTWPGAKKAVDEFLASSGEVLTKSPYSGRYYIVKK